MTEARGNRFDRARDGRLAAVLVLTAVVWAGAARAEAPARIVSLAPSVTEILFALGVGERVVGVSTYCDYPPAAKRVDRIGTFLTPNVELILAKRPDLVIGVPSPGNRAPVENLQSLGLQVLIVDPEGVAAIATSIRDVARAVGVEAAGERLVYDIDTKLAAIAARLAGAPAPRVLMVVGRVPLVAAGRGTYQDELIQLAHGTNVAAPSGERWPHLSLEFAIKAAPEVIIDASMGSESEPGGAAGREFWQGLSTIPAVRDRRLYGYRVDHLLRPGPRVPETLETMARFIHPERFASPAPAEGRP